jgi:hypothetical protein
MKRLCISKIFLLVLLYTGIAHAALTDKSVIVYYGDDLSWSMAGIHEYIIVQPDHIATDTHGFQTYRDHVYAYVSLGEVEPNQSYYKKVRSEWFLGHNKQWKSRIVDFTQKAYRTFILEEVIAPLHKRGFKHFFFDTLDSYHIPIKDETKRKQQASALAMLIHEIHQRYPESHLVLNRGFEILEEVSHDISAILFESYYYGLDSKLQYAKVSKSDREWLDKQLAPARKEHLDIIAVDYLKDPYSTKAKKDVSVLMAAGFIPYVSDRNLERYGISSKKAFKREVLMLYDGQQYPSHYQGVHQYGSLPLEYMGYIPVLKDFRVTALPQYTADRYAGVILWFDNKYPKPEKLFRWVMENSQSGVKTLFFRSFGVNLQSNILSTLGIGVKKVQGAAGIDRKIIDQASMMNFENQPVIQAHDTLLKPKNAISLLRYREGQETSTLAALTSWGGYAIEEASMIEFGEDNLWMIDPFSLYQKALNLIPMPVPDPTTENGLRLLFSHIDGDGIMNRAEWNPKLFSGEVIYENILSKYQIPHTVSIVDAEIVAEGLYPKLSSQLESLVRSMYALKNVEAATHTFSHPFIWSKIENGDLSPKYRLKVPGYEFSLDRELSGSLEYINTQLLPPEKAKARTVLWSGDCLPTEEVLRNAYHHHHLNMNGGDTTITNDHPWLYNIAPYAIRKGDYYQIYTGAQNENIYTNEFHGPFWGFKKVIQTFKLTELPRRFKPIDIYYHFYSGSKIASLKALKTVFEWAVNQEVMPVYTSDYILKVLEFYDVSMAKEGDKWLLSGMNNLRTLRLSNDMPELDFDQSRGVIGMKKELMRRYVSLFGKKNKLLVLSDKPTSNSYLVSANAKVSSFEKEYYSFTGYVPLETAWHLEQGCQLKASPLADKTFTERGITYLQYEENREATIHVICQ